MSWLLILLIFCPMAFANQACPSHIGNETPIARMNSTGVTTCWYASSSIGSDTSYDGTQETISGSHGPWAHIPGMVSCTGNCSAHTVAAGDGYVLRGGDTWTSSDLGISWQTSGSATHWIYIGGADTTWYSGASWNRPVFTCGGGTCSGTANAMFQHGGGSDNGRYLQVDDIEWTGRSFSDDRGYFQGYADNAHVTNNYFHGWNHTGESGDSGFIVTIATCCGGSGIDDRVGFNVVDGSDTTKDSAVAFFHATEVAYNYDAWTTNGAEGAFDTVHDNVFDHIPVSFAAGAHQNAIQQQATMSSATNATVYNNLVTDVQAGGIAKIWVAQNSGNSGNTTYTFDNIEYNNQDGNDFDICQLGTSCGTHYIFSNSIQCGTDTSAGSCAGPNGTVQPSMTAYIVDNYCINAVSGAAPNNCLAVTAGTYLTYTYTTNLAQSVATANGQGYSSTSTYAWQPTSGSGSTVGAGTNEQAYCTLINAFDSVAAAACQHETSYGIVYNAPTHTVSQPAISPYTARPSSTAWDIGAYQFSGNPVTAPGNSLWLASR